MERALKVLSRDVAARLVPDGTQITIPKDTFVTLTQDLGGNFTVVVNGNMARIDGTDADALGLDPLVLEYQESGDGRIDRDDVWKTLKTIFDPEIPVNIVDLGLVRDCSIDDADRQVDVRMTLTAPGCGMGEVLVEDVRYRLAQVPNVDTVHVEMVFDPPWSREMMSEEAQLELGLL